MHRLKVLKTAVAAASLALSCAAYAGTHYSFTFDDFPQAGDFVFETGDTVQIFIDTIPTDPLFTGNVTINGGSLIVTGINGFDTSSFDDDSVFQAFTPGQFSGDFDSVSIFGQQAYQTMGSSVILADNDALHDFDTLPRFIVGDIQIVFSGNTVNTGQIPTFYYSEDGSLWMQFINTTPVPEPSTYALLLAAGIGGIALLRLRRRKA